MVAAVAVATVGVGVVRTIQVVLGAQGAIKSLSCSNGLDQSGNDWLGTSISHEGSVQTVSEARGRILKHCLQGFRAPSRVGV